MNCAEYTDAASFLAAAGAALERHESANALMLSIAMRLVDEPNAYGPAAYLATVQAGGALRAAALMAPPHKLQVHIEDETDVDALTPLVDGLLAGGWQVPTVLAREATATAFAEMWSARTGTAPRMGKRQGVYELRKLVPPPATPGAVRRAEEGDLELFLEWWAGFMRDCFGEGQPGTSVELARERLRSGAFYFWCDGEPVSMAGRPRSTPHGEFVGGVYTPPERRRRGYASALVAALSRAALDEGFEFCALYTDLANPTSNGIYRKLGYRQVAEMVDIHFEGGKLPAKV